MSTATTTSKPLKPKRGTTAQNNNYTGEAYEVTLDTDKKTLVVHDGLTAGGFPLARADEVATKDAAQDEAIAEAKSSAEAAQSTANTALDKANNITVPVTSVNGQTGDVVLDISAPVTSVNGMTGAVTVGTVRSVNGVAADASGNVSVSAGITTVKGQIGSAVASNGNSLALPSGGTWFVWNVYNYYKEVSTYRNYYYGVSTKSGSAMGWTHSGTFSGGTTLYATCKNVDSEGDSSYSAVGKLAAIRIS